MPTRLNAFAGLLLILFLFAAAPAQTPAHKRPLNITGHYKLSSSETPNSLQVQQLPGAKIKFHILALWVSAHNRDNVHNGELQAIIDIKGDSAVFQSETCKVTIKFSAGRATVTQDHEVGDCYFGANVSATGTYRKANSRKPKFDF